VITHLALGHRVISKQKPALPFTECHRDELRGIPMGIIALCPFLAKQLSNRLHLIPLELDTRDLPNFRECLPLTKDEHSHLPRTIL
jgi:hypothetical protein